MKTGKAPKKLPKSFDETSHASARSHGRGLFVVASRGFEISTVGILNKIAPVKGEVVRITARCTRATTSDSFLDTASAAGEERGH